MMRRSVLTAFLLSLITLAAMPAQADCTTPAGVEGHSRYDFTAHALYICTGTTWTNLSAGGSSQWSNGSGSDIYYNGGNVGIGTTSPAVRLDVSGNFRITNPITPSAGLLGTWWNTTSLSGTVLLQTVHTDIDFTDLNPGGQADNWSGRLTGYVRTNAAGTYTFYNTADDGHRMWVAGAALVDWWGAQGPTERSGSLSLAANTWYPIEIQHYEATAGERLLVQWSGPGIGKQKIPSSNLATGPQAGTVAMTVDALTGDLVTSGNLTVSVNAYKPGGGEWTASSDARLKDIDGAYDQGLDSIMRLNTVRFHYKKDNARKEPSDRPFVGLVAQDVQKVFPEAVSSRGDGYLDLDTTPINFALINAVKELKAANDNAAAQIDELRNELKALKASVGK